MEEPNTIPHTIPTELPPLPPRESAGPSPRPQRSVLITLGVLVVILIGLTGWRVMELHHQAGKTAANPVPATSATGVSTSGSDNQSLTSDLNTVGAGLSSESQAQASADAAINDQQQEVNVPTN